MSLAQSLRAKLVDPSVPNAWAKAVASRIRSVASPVHIILFGSAAEGRFREGSDLDLLLVFADVEALRLGRKHIRSLGRLFDLCPVDLVFVSEQHYHDRRDLGGICFIAAHHGVNL